MDKDVRRTDRSNPYYKGSRNVAMLRRVLLTYCMYNFDLGYCQAPSSVLFCVLLCSCRGSLGHDNLMLCDPHKSMGVQHEDPGGMSTSADCNDCVHISNHPVSMLDLPYHVEKMMRRPGKASHIEYFL